MKKTLPNSLVIFADSMYNPPEKICGRKKNNQELFVKRKVLILALVAFSSQLVASDEASMRKEIQLLQRQTKALQTQLEQLNKKLATHTTTQPRKKSLVLAQKNKKITLHKKIEKIKKGNISSQEKSFHSVLVRVNAIDGDPQSGSFYPTALIGENKVITYIAGTPVVTSPYTGDRPAFDGSDYIVNISSINRDLRLMEQRRRLYAAYQQVGYPIPHMPIIALSGKTEPLAELSRGYLDESATGDFNLGSSELDVAALLNDKVESFMSLAYDDSPPLLGGPRVKNSTFFLNQGFVNIGNLDITPYYLTAGQIYVPFGRFSSAMVSSPLPMRLARTKSRPFILGYKSQTEPGPFAAVYGFKSETTDGHSGVGGINLGYRLKSGDLTGEIGTSYIGSIADSEGMQLTGSPPGTTFGGFGSPSNGSEAVHKVPALGFHGTISYNQYNFTAEWIGATQSFSPQDLSFNGQGAKPTAGQLELGVTFKVFSKPSSLAAGYQWSQQTLALNMPARRFSGVFNISIWKDTVESLEYRHDIDFKSYQFANGAAPVGSSNENTIGTGRSSDALIAQIGVYF